MSCLHRALWYTSVVLLIGSGCQKEDAPDATPEKQSESSTDTKPMKVDITPQEAKQLLDAEMGYVYLDVRTVAEFEEGHAPGSVNVPYLTFNEAGERVVNADFLAVVHAVFPKDARVIVACRSGGRSKMAQEVMLAVGYANVSNLLGGFLGHGEPAEGDTQQGWSSLGYPVDTGDGGSNSYSSQRSKIKP